MEGKLRVLVVDDDATYREVARELIEELGHECVEADDGQKAVELYRRVKPDGVLMDIMMPVMDGIEAFAVILTEDPEAQVLFSSSLDAFPEGAPCEIPDGLQIRRKPWTLETMREILKTLQPRPAQQQVG